MSRTNWKRVERTHSTLLKCQGRTGPTGRDLPDSYSDLLTVESKCTITPPRFVQEALTQARENTGRLGQDERARDLASPDRLPVVVIHEDHKRFEDDLVVMGLAEFRQRVLPALEYYEEAKKRAQYNELPALP
jgi:hypothetical protein